MSFLVKQTHGPGLLGVGYADVGTHGLVVAVTRPLHHCGGGYAHRQGVADERPPPGVGADEFVLGPRLLDALGATVGHGGHGRVDSGQIGHFLQPLIHALVADHGQRPFVVGILGQNGPRVLVQLDAERVARLAGHDGDGVRTDVGACRPSCGSRRNSAGR